MIYCITAKREDLAGAVLKKLQSGFSRYRRPVPVGGGHYVQMMKAKQEVEICLESAANVAKKQKLSKLTTGSELQKPGESDPTIQTIARKRGAATRQRQHRKADG